MIKKKEQIAKKLLWLDLEMTGLRNQIDLITEVAVIVTDFSLNPITEYSCGVYQPKMKLSRLLNENAWFKGQPQAYQDDIYKISANGQPLGSVEVDLIKIIDKFIEDESVILAGNSIATDRGFIETYLPKFAARLHYRMLDVSAYKIYFQSVKGLEFKKKETHRALDDIYESIAEFKFYLKQIK